MRVLWFVLVLTAGCDQVLGLEERDAGTDAALDALSDAPIDASLPPMWNAPQGDLALPIGAGDDPSLTSDLLELYWNTSSLDVARTTRATQTAAWSPSVVVAELSSPTSDTTPDVSGDGRVLYLSSDRPGGLGMHDIMIATRATPGAAWSAPVWIPELNTDGEENGASATADGLTIVFASTRPGGVGSHDLWMSTRVATSVAWNAPVTIANVNTVESEANPCIAADGLAVYFMRAVSGTYDLYVATRPRRDVPFEAPVAISELNSPTESDDDPWVSPDGHHIFYMRNSGLPTSQLLHATR